MHNFIVFNEIRRSQLVLCDSGDTSHRNSCNRLTYPHAVDTSSRNKSPGFQQGTQRPVAVILGYYNGNKYLPEQIRSILDQSHQNLEIFISDDCSNSKVDIDGLDLTSDDTQKIRLGVRSSNVGCSNNFLGALSRIDSPFEYFAFSDQDDVWRRDKIADALAILAQYPDDQPVLYCARTTITNENCQVDLGASPLYGKPPSFANALAQNIAGGNTMVFNKAARNLIVKSTTNVDILLHDWWCYLIVSGAGGTVYYDPKPCLEYRQHSENLAGLSNDLGALLMQARNMLGGGFRNWIDINLAALSKNRALLTPDNQRRLDDFIEARQSSLLKRLFLFKRAGIYRQTFLSNLVLLLSLIINKT